MNQITDQIFLSGYESTSDRGFLKERNITHILTVGADLPPQHPTDFKYLVVPVQDSMDVNLLPKHFFVCRKFIRQAVESGTNILVHCRMGVSRSATIVIAYLMVEDGMTLAEAFQHVKGIRFHIQPNPGFQRQLEQLEE